MTYIVLGSGLALLELWTIASQRGGAFYNLPQGIRLLIPALIAVGSFRRPRVERIPIGFLAIGLGLSLNRDLTGNAIAAHVAVIACGLSAAWSGHRSTTPIPNEQRRLLLAILLVGIGLLGFFALGVAFLSQQ
jgi:hypothetical protein